MNKINISITAAALLLMTACGSEPKTDDTPENTAPVEKSTEQVCTYSFDQSQTKISWTSFKTTAKVAVGGTFDEFSVTNTVPSTSKSAIFENAEFKITTASVNTGNEERDPKIIGFFFNSMVESDYITGGISTMSEDVDGKGAATFYIEMNGVKKDVHGSYTINGEELTLSATIDVADWNATEGITALNTECYDLHKGEDGVSKLWSEVDVEITTVLTKTCE